MNEDRITSDYRPANVEPGAVIAGRYTLIELIGAGGMGEVWIAKQTEPVKRKVALKLIKPGMDSRAVLTRFEQERQALAVMDHPNIAKVFDGGMSDAGRPFFVMELVPGLPLTKFCDQARLGIKERLELFITVCQAVQHAHQKGIIHRDLKPSNILVGLVDGRPTPKVIDFGVAKATVGKLTDESLSTQFGAVVGTLEYMPPEQAGLSLADVDTRADIYALGVILYELLTGLRPFDAKRLREAALDEMIRIIREEEPSKPSTRLSSDTLLLSLAAMRQSDPHRLTKLLRGDLDSIVMKALEKDRNRRYETATGFAADVLRHLHGEPVLAHPPSAGYRLRKFLRKNRAPVIVAGVVFLLLLGGIIGTTLGLFEAKRQEGIARAEAKRANDEKDRAEDEKRVAQNVRDLLQLNKLRQLGDLPVMSPIEGELLDRAAKELSHDRIDRNFPNQPLLQAEILRTVANVFHKSGKFTLAIGFLERSAALRRQILGADHQDTLASLSDLADAYQSTDKHTEAISLLEQVCAIQEKKLGADHLDTLTTLRNLGELYQANSQLPEAIRLFERVHEANKKRGDDPLTKIMATMHLRQLINAYQAADKHAEAIHLLEQERAIQKKTLGADHRDTIIMLNDLAFAYGLAGKTDQALPLYRQAAMGMEKRKFQDEGAGIVVSNLTACHEKLNQFDQAEVWHRKWLAVVKERDGADSLPYAQELAFLGRNLLQQKKWADAETVLRECLAIRVKQQPDVWNTFNTQSTLGGALLGQKKFADAEPLLLAGYEGMKQRQDKIPDNSKVWLPEAIERLVQLYEALDKKDEAAKWRKVLNEVKKKE